MFDVNVINRQLFSFWFTRIGVQNEWEVVDTTSQRKVATVYIQDNNYHVRPETDDLEADKISAILSDFDKWRTGRPEVYIGRRVSKELIGKEAPNPEQLRLIQEEIEHYIFACCYATLGSDDVANKYAMRAIDWLKGTDFYTAPASTVYHDNVPGGLAKHTLKVVDKVIELSTIDTYSMVDLAQAILAAIAHDFCKIDFYQPYMKNVKNEETGVWEKELAYKYKGSSLPFGHGVTSMFIAMKIFKLTTEQALAIRWHMNEYDVSDNQKHDLMDANEKFPMVTMLQTADRLSVL